MKKQLALVILNCTLIFLTGSFSTFGQEKVLDLKDKKITIQMDKQPLGAVFGQLIVKYNVPIGFEESTLDSEHNDYDFETNLPYFKEQMAVKPDTEQKAVKKDGEIKVSIKLSPYFEVKQHWITVNIENGSLEDVLNQIVSQMKNYKWEINDDVVNIFPTQGRDERYEKLLELNIENFNLKVQNPPIFVIRNRILALPEFKKFLEENKLEYDFSRGYAFATLDRRLPEGMNFSNLKFRELLNKITKVKKGGWILRKDKRYNPEEKEVIDIEI